MIWRENTSSGPGDKLFLRREPGRRATVCRTGIPPLPTSDRPVTARFLGLWISGLRPEREDPAGWDAGEYGFDDGDGFLVHLLLRGMVPSVVVHVD